MFQKGEILKVAFIQKRPFSFEEKEKINLRKNGISAQINSVLSQMVYGQASVADLSNAIQSGWKTTNSHIQKTEEGLQETRTVWIQVGDKDLSSQISAIESDKNFVGWVDQFLIDELKRDMQSH
jgi:hypothetical protein